MIANMFYSDNISINWEFGFMSLVPVDKRDDFLKYLNEDDGEV